MEERPTKNSYQKNIWQLAVKPSININNESMMKYSLIMNHVLLTVSLKESLTLKFC